MKMITKRLALRPYEANDADEIHELLLASSSNEENVMESNNIADWIKSVRTQHEKGERTVFAITLKKGGDILGSIDLTIEEDDPTKAALGYWMGYPFRDQGFCTEAGHLVLQYGFSEMHLKTIYADFYTWNVSSGRVMEKLGMTYEKTFDKFAEQWDKFMEVDRYNITQGEVKT